MSKYQEDESYLRKLEQEIAQKLGVMPSSVDIIWYAPVSEHCVYVEGKYYDYLNNVGSVDIYD